MEPLLRRNLLLWGRRMPMRVLMMTIGTALILQSPATAQDPAQYCMAACLRYIDTPTYGTCIARECNEPNRPSPRSAKAKISKRVDFSVLYGSWYVTHTPCGQPSDDILTINATGVSAFEETCKAYKVKMDGPGTFTFHQSCEYFDNEKAKSVLTVKLLKSGELLSGEQKYKRCD